MFSIMRLLAIGLVLAVVGCAAPGGWQGAETEKAYDKELEIKRLAAILNNDDYYEFEKDGRIYVLSDAKEYTGYLSTGEIPLSTKKIGGGPGGKTIVYGLIKNEAKLMEKDPKSQGAAQKMFEGNLKGMDKDFFGLVIRGDTQYVFNSWKDLEAFRSQGTATGFSEASEAGGTVVYVNSTDKPKSAAERYARLTPPK